MIDSCDVNSLIMLLLPSLAGAIFLFIWLLIQNYKVDKKKLDYKRRRLLLLGVPLLTWLAFFIFLSVYGGLWEQKNRYESWLLGMQSCLLLSVVGFVFVWTVFLICRFIYFIFKKQIIARKIWQLAIIVLIIFILYFVLPGSFSERYFVFFPPHGIGEISYSWCSNDDLPLPAKDTGKICTYNDECTTGVCLYSIIEENLGNCAENGGYSVGEVTCNRVRGRDVECIEWGPIIE